MKRNFRNVTMARLSVKTKKLYWQIRQDTVSLHYRGSLIFGLFGNRKKRKLLKAASPIVFDRVIYNDVLDAMVLDLARLLDPATQRGGKFVNASLAKLIEEVAPLSPGLARKLRARRNKMLRGLRKIDRWRDKWAAHRDYRTMLKMRTPSKATSRVRFNPAKIKAALVELDVFPNAFESVFEDKNVTPRTADQANRLIPGVTDYSAFDATNEIESLVKILSST